MFVFMYELRARTPSIMHNMQEQGVKYAANAWIHLYDNVAASKKAAHNEPTQLNKISSAL